MRHAAVPSILLAVVFVGASDPHDERLYALELPIEENVPQPSPINEAKPTERPKYPEGYIEEGPLPEGFPPPSEVGQIVEKIYPLCRSYSAEGDNAFWRCFTYLTQHKHEMTAPVIMDYKRREKSDAAKVIADVNAMDVKRMHFVLDRPSLDELKREGPVVVADIPAMRVLSIAFQGQLSAEVIQQAEKKLAAEVANRKNLMIVGPYRLLGYNSPFAPKGKAFSEIQVPVAEKRPAHADGNN